MEKRKKERQKVVTKKRNLESLAKDAKRRAEDFERRVSELNSTVIALVYSSVDICLAGEAGYCF